MTHEQDARQQASNDLVRMVRLSRLGRQGDRTRALKTAQYRSRQPKRTPEPPVGTFLEEAGACLATLQARLSTEPTPRPFSRELALELWRSLRLIESGAGFLGHPRLELAAFDAQSVLTHLRESGSLLTPSALAVLMDLLGSLQEQVAVLRSHRTLEPAADHATALRLPALRAVPSA